MFGQPELKVITRKQNLPTTTDKVHITDEQQINNIFIIQCMTSTIFCNRIKTRNPEINKIKNNNNMQYVLFFTNNIQLLTVDDFNKIF